MSDTPRTDAAEKHAYEYDDDMTPVVESGIARRLERDLAEAQQQRDRLAEALGKLIRLDDQMIDPDYEESGTYAGAYYCYYKGERDTWDNAREALAAAKGEEPVDPHKYCRGGGGNNFHCGCKYDAQNHESYYP
jgi:hypothetical protein